MRENAITPATKYMLDIKRRHHLTNELTSYLLVFSREATLTGGDRYLEVVTILD